MVAGVIAAWLAALIAAAAVTPLLTGQLRLFGLLAACSAVAVEVTRRSGEPGGVDRDVYAIWDLPVALLLPPLYALLLPVPRMIMTQWRIRRAPVHRRAYTAAAVGLAYAAASLAFRATVPALGAGTGTGGRALAWTALAAGCGLLRLAVNDGLILAAVKGSSPGTPLLPELIGPEAVYGNVAELSVSVLSAFAAYRSPLLVLWALPLVVMLQRGLRWAQLMRESRTDAKTGLLNDAAWRRAAAAELARAARAGTVTAVAIADIDHFKRVNDTYGHAAGDAVLAAVAATIRAELRDYDAIGRVGGEEMAFVLPATSYPEAIAAAQRVRLAIFRADLAGGGLQVPPFVTVSVGVAVAGNLAGWDLARHYGLADSALYAAKRSGRNCVWGVCDGQAEGLTPRPGIARAALPASATAELGTLPGHATPARRPPAPPLPRCLRRPFPGPRLGRPVTPPATGQAAGFRVVFGLREFRALWAAQLLSVAGDQLARVALTVLVYQRTSSALLAAAAYAASIAPQFAGGLLLSGLADRHPRRAVMVACDLARVPLAALMAVPRMPVAALIGLLCAVTALGAPFGAARAAVYPDVLGDAYPLGAAVTMSTLQAAQVLGFTAGGALVEAAGVQAAMLADAGTFCGSALIVAAWVRRRPAAAGQAPARPARGAAAAALRLVLASPAARGALLLGWVSAAYNVPEGLAAPLARACGGGPVAASLIMAVPAAGAAAGAVALTRLAGPAARQRLTVPLAFTACAVLTAAIARPHLPVLLAILALSGLCDSYQVQAQASFVTAVPAASLGQAFGLAAGGMQLGQGAAMLLAGAAAQGSGPWLAIAVAGAAGAVAVAGISAASRSG